MVAKLVSLMSRKEEKKIPQVFPLVRNERKKLIKLTCPYCERQVRFIPRKEKWRIIVVKCFCRRNLVVVNDAKGIRIVGKEKEMKREAFN